MVQEQPGQANYHKWLLKHQRNLYKRMKGGKMESKFCRLNILDLKRFFRSAVVWLAPLGVLYFSEILVSLQAPGHRFVLEDLYPSQFAIGGIVLYIINRLYDLSLKFVRGK